MTKDNQHPDRGEMLRAIRTGRIPFARHLAECEDCQNLFAMLSRVHTGVEEIDESPGEHAVYRHRAIALLVQSRHPRSSVDGDVVFDSWAHLPPTQVRAATLEGERRLRLKAGRFTLEFIADRQLDGWEFVARVYDQTRATSEFVLQVGQKKLYPCAQQCFFWSAKHPPRRIQLLSPELRIDFGRLRW